jgi:hypothetical protein
MRVPNIAEHAATFADARFDNGALPGQAVGAAADAPQYDPDGHITGKDAFTGQYRPATTPP